MTRRRLRKQKKSCPHFEKVAGVCDEVLAGRMPPSDLGTRTLAEEYLMLFVEFKALRLHLDEAE